MFSCTFQNGQKTVEVCDTSFWEDGDNASYGFFENGGALQKEIRSDKASLIGTPWNGIGKFESESVTFFSEDYGYEVWWGAARDPSSKLEGGIIVTQSSSTLAHLTCDAGSVRQNMSPLLDAIETAQISP